jgi:hypothetical protein
MNKCRNQSSGEECSDHAEVHKLTIESLHYLLLELG